MKNKKFVYLLSLLFALVCLFGSIGFVFASDTLMATVSSTDSSFLVISRASQSGTYTYAVGQTFVSTVNSFLGSVQFKLYRSNAIAVDVPIYLEFASITGTYGVDAVNATTIAYSDSIMFNSLVYATPTWTSFSFGPNATLVAGVNYAVVLRVNSTGAIGGNIFVGSPNLDVYSGNSFRHLDETVVSTSDYCVRIYYDDLNYLVDGSSPAASATPYVNPYTDNTGYSLLDNDLVLFMMALFYVFIPPMLVLVSCPKVGMAGFMLVLAGTAALGVFYLGLPFYFLVFVALGLGIMFYGVLRRS